MILYLSRAFPLISETFVLQEIVALRKAGERASVLTLKTPASSERADLSAYPHLTHYIFDKRHLLKSLGTKGFIRCVFTLLYHVNYKHILRFFTMTSSVGKAYLLKIALAIYALPEKPRALHCHFGPMGLIAHELNMFGLVQLPYSTVFHGFDISRPIQKAENPYTDLFKTGHAFLPVSDYYHRSLLALGAPPEKIKTYHMGINLNDFPNSNHTPTLTTPFRFLSIGRMTEKKGHLYTLEAAALLKSQYPDLNFQLDIIGGGDLLGALQSRCKELNAQSYITLHGALQHDAVKTYLNQAHCFVLPSVTAADGDMEGIPIALMEAMAMGLPVISTRHSGIPELIEDNVSGLLVDERDVPALAAAMYRVMTAPDTVKDYVISARQKIETDFNQERQISFLRNILDKICENTL